MYDDNQGIRNNTFSILSKCCYTTLEISASKYNQ